MQIKRPTLAVLAIAALAVLTLASLAQAGEVTRASYAEGVEPICKVNTQANEKILKGVKAEVKANKLKPAAAQFTKASAAFAKAVKQIGAVPQPTADQAKLAKWLGYLGEEQKLLGEIGKALKAADKSKAQTLSVRLTHNGNLANNSVLGFEFNYCLIDSSRFS